MGRLCVLALNARTLAPKLAMLLSLPFDVLCLSEVRASYSAKSAMSRIAASNGFTCVWSGSPPPSRTFAVSPGRAAIFARCPLALQEIRPPNLEKCNLRGRVCVAHVMMQPNIPISRLAQTICKALCQIENCCKGCLWLTRECP